MSPLLMIPLVIAACALSALLAARIILPRLVDRRLADYQNELVGRHCAEVENIYAQMRGWRHDYHNHIQTLQAYLASGDIQRIGPYLRALGSDLETVDTILKTGNIMVDAILNSKLSLAKREHIAIDATAHVPKELRVSEIDLCVALGNLLDNAMEACFRMEDAQARFIRVYLGVLKGQLYINVTNAMQGRPSVQGGRFVSTKQSPTHGFGLARIDRICEKYGGYLNRQHEEGVFATELMLPL